MEAERDWPERGGLPQADAEGVVDPLQAGVAKAVVDSGNNLYSLQREKRDLETVFRQINEGAAPGEFSDAA